MSSGTSAAGSSPCLYNSKTSIPKVTYVPLKTQSDPPKQDAPSSAGGALRKASFLSSLSLQPGEVNAVLTPAGSGATTPGAASLADALKPFEVVSRGSAPRPSAAPLSSVSDADLIAFGQSLTEHRRQVLEAATAPKSTSPETEPRTSVDPISDVTVLQQRANTAAFATNALQNAANSATSPIGMLNLERIETMPAGIERGGLIATIPLAPKERTVVVQQEWSVISQDFTSIVTDSLENYSETGVTDSTQLSQSTSSQVAHANQFNVNSTASGSCGFVTTSVAVGFGTQDKNSSSAADSRQHAVQTTKKASSRSVQSHKVTISTSTTSGSSTSNTRMLENPSATDTMRIDYFSMMRKWHCALYRYGLRMTYDITVPEPGAALRKVYAQLDSLKSKVNNQFVFDVKASDITLEIKPGQHKPAYQVLADTYSVDVPPPPSPSELLMQVGPVGFSNTNNIGPKTFSVKSGYWIKSIIISNHIGSTNLPNDPFVVVGCNVGGLYAGRADGVDLCKGNSYLWHQSGEQSITLLWADSNHEDAGYLFLSVYCEPSDTTMAQWRSSVWSALYNAAQARFYAQQQSINAQITALEAQISNVDTLTLRREENDEIMRCAVRWLLNSNFEFMPQYVVNLFDLASDWQAKYGINFVNNASGLNNKTMPLIKENEDRINFINQAIDWDNVLYFLYSYFWDVPSSWDFISQIQHPDATRQAFLRAGGARIVLTVRPGWEAAWIYFVENDSLNFPSTMPMHGYYSIARQIEDYNATNYPGIPPANAAGGGPIDDGTPQAGTTSSDTLKPSASPVTIAVNDSSGFIPGATAIIDTWESQVQENQTIVAVPDTKHIVVSTISNTHRVSAEGNKPYPIFQAGSSGELIAEWFEYTPTSGTDIAVTSNLSTIA